MTIRPKFEVEFEPLWNLKGTEKSQVDSTIVTMLRDLKNDGIIPAEKVIDEINAKKIFPVELSTDEIPDISEVEYNNFTDTEPQAEKAIGELKNVGSDTKQKA